MSRPSDQWLKSETAVLEAAEVTIGLVTVANELTIASLPTVDVNSMPATPAGENYIGLATVDLGAASLDAGEAFIGLATVIVEGYSGLQYTSNTTGNIKSGAGVLHSVSIHNASCPTISLWDSTVPSGTKIMDIPPNLTVGSHYIYDINFGTGLTVQGTAGVSPNVVISYR